MRLGQARFAAGRGPAIGMRPDHQPDRVGQQLFECQGIGGRRMDRGGGGRFIVKHAGTGEHGVGQQHRQASGFRPGKLQQPTHHRQLLRPGRIAGRQIPGRGRERAGVQDPVGTKAGGDVDQVVRITGGGGAAVETVERQAGARRRAQHFERVCAGQGQVCPDGCIDADDEQLFHNWPPCPASISVAAGRHPWRSASEKSGGADCSFAPVPGQGEFGFWQASNLRQTGRVGRATAPPGKLGVTADCAASQGEANLQKTGPKPGRGQKESGRSPSYLPI